MPEWKRIPEYPDYEASDEGNIKSYRRDRWGNDRPPRILKPGRGQYGRLAVHVTNANGQRYMAVHQLVLMAFVGPMPKGMEVCHGNGDASDNHLENLRYDTRAANVADQKRHGTNIRPTMRRVTDAEVAEIRARYIKGNRWHPSPCDAGRLAAEYGISKPHVYDILNGRKRCAE